MSRKVIRDCLKIVHRAFYFQRLRENLAEAFYFHGMPEKMAEAFHFQGLSAKGDFGSFFFLSSISFAMK